MKSSRTQRLHKSDRPRKRPDRPPLRRTHMETIEPDEAGGFIVGRHPVLEALRRGRSLNRLWIRQGMGQGSLREIMALAAAARVPVGHVPEERLELMAGGVPHQGVIASLSVATFLRLEELESLFSDQTDGVVFLLDQIQDPQNMGAIVRVADAIGAKAVVVPERGGAGLTAAMAKASAGAVEYIPVARVGNMVQAVEKLQAWGFFVYAASPEAERWYTDIRWNGKIGLVIGSEGKGVRPLVKSKCDELIKIPMQGQVASLNAAAAAAVIGYEIIRQQSNKI